MRIPYLAAMAAAVVFCGAAQAQTYPGNTQYGVPIYNTTGNGTPTYYSTNNGAAPVYNNIGSTPPMPLQAMIAGKNAPSYQNPNQIQPYNFQSAPNAYTGGAMTPEQQVQMYQQQLLNQQQQQPRPSYVPQQQAQNNMTGGYGGGFTGGPFGTTPDSQVPIKKRVRYKEMNNPLSTPPRLFNPDQ